MSTMPVFAACGFHEEVGAGDCARSYLSDSLMPLFYMGDYSVLGLLVNDLPRALRILAERGFLVSVGTNSTVSQVETRNLQEVIRLLHLESIDVEIADIVKEVYQG